MRTWECYIRCTSLSEGWTYWLRYSVSFEAAKTAEKAADIALGYLAGRSDRVHEIQVFSQAPHSYLVEMEAEPKITYTFKRGMRV